MNAIIDLIASYYVFDISYPKGVQGHFRHFSFLRTLHFLYSFVNHCPLCVKLVTSLKKVAF